MRQVQPADGTNGLKAKKTSLKACNEKLEMGLQVALTGERTH